ncbi:MAG: hypothetical protein Q8P50_02180 [Bacillota bacterium]|nr:hypothetical protein [Bacillota bacterium]
MVEVVRYHDEMLALIIRAAYRAEGIQFFTPPQFSQQLAYMSRPSGHVIEPHVHNAVTRQVHLTAEVLFVKSGKVRVDFYSPARAYLESRVLEQGDVILLAAGGHGFEILESCELIEVKQGPYAGALDKTTFRPIDTINIRLGGHDE